MHNKLPIPVAILVVLVLGALIGLVNGLIVTKLRVNSVIATLGVGTIIVGLAFAYSSGVPIVAGVPEAFLQLSLGRWLFGIPNPIIVMALVVGGLWALVERTAIGQEIQAVGGNPAAARLAGISVDRIKILGFIISGMCAALTGALLASRLGSGTTSAADSYLLTAFAAVFLGIGDAARRRIPCVRDFHRHAHHCLRLQRSQYLRRPDLFAICLSGRHFDRRGRALEPRPNAGGKLTGESNVTQSAIWDVYVMEFARSKDQPWVDLISGMYHEGVMDLPFSFILAQQGGRNVLVDTGFHAERTRLRVLPQIQHPDLDIARSHAFRNERRRRRRSPTSS